MHTCRVKSVILYLFKVFVFDNSSRKSEIYVWNIRFPSHVRNVFWVTVEYKYHDYCSSKKESYRRNCRIPWKVTSMSSVIFRRLPDIRPWWLVGYNIQKKSDTESVIQRKPYIWPKKRPDSGHSAGYWIWYPAVLCQITKMSHIWPGRPGTYSSTSTILPPLDKYVDYNVITSQISTFRSIIIWTCSFSLV